jgi:hypothetical protein
MSGRAAPRSGALARPRRDGRVERARTVRYKWRRRRPVGPRNHRQERWEEGEQMRRSVFAIVAALLLVPAMSSAKDFEHAEAKLSIWIPDGWHTDTDDGMLAVKDPKEEIGILFIVMDAVFIDGKGKADGKPVDFSVGLVVTPAGKVMMMLGIAESSKFKTHEANVEKILKGVKPLAK